MKKMKAVVCTQYGPPEVLHIQDVEKPICTDNSILIRIRASSVNSGDVRIRSLAVNKFLKFIMQFILGFNKPRNPILGTVYAGIIEEIGKNVNRFQVGEKVFGMTGFNFGAYSEYITVTEKNMVTQMPTNASFEEAAALPFGWHTAIYFLEKAGINKAKNPKILIYGSTGSVGTAAVQLAQSIDAELTVVCSSAGKGLMEYLCVKDIMHYDLQDITQIKNKYDIIFDAVGKITKSKHKHLLASDGKFVTVNSLDMAKGKISHLHYVKELFESGKCEAIIDKTFSLAEIVEANRYVDSGKKKGNVVVINSKY